MIAQAPPRGLRIEPAYASGPAQSPLWLPKRIRPKLVLPEHAHTMKVIYFKGRIWGDPRWFGDVLRCHYNVDLDEPGHDGVTLRNQIHLKLTGLLERASGGTWVYQESDERNSTTVIEEWPEFQHTPERWARFYRRER